MAEAPTSVSDLVDVLRADVRAKLLDLLDEISGRKVLMLDSTIVGPLDLIVSPSDLKDHGVQNWYRLTDQAIASDCTQMIFLIRCSRVELVDYIAAQILADEAQGKDRTYIVVFTPRKTEECVERLGQANVRANVKIIECEMHFFPFDRDVLSLEMPGVFQEFHAQGIPSGVFYAAKALMFMQSKFGIIPSVHAIGSAAKTAVDVMLRLRKEEQMSEALKEAKPMNGFSQPGVPPVAPHARQSEEAGAAQAPKVREVVIIDRRVDLFSALCSPFTYQALIDMAYGVSNNATDVSSSSWAKGKHSHVRLSPDDPFYQEIKELHIDKLGPLLQEKARAIQKTYAEKDQKMNPNEMAEYIKKFKTAQSFHPLLEIHINLAHDLRDRLQSDDYRQRLKLEDDITAQGSSAVLEVIEDYIDDQMPLHEVLRLLCLYSLVNNGVKAKQLDQIKRSIIQSYGYEHLLTLSNMERAGVLRYQQGKSVWSSIKRHFNLFVEDTQAERDISYAYSGYAPLSVRLVQMTRSSPKGWRSCQDALSLLHGPAQELQQPPPGGAKSDAKEPSPSPGQPAVCLVCFLGGVTHGELAALRKLGELEEGRRQFLVVTTEFLNAKKFFTSLRNEQAFEQPPVQAKKSAQPQQDQKKGGFGFWPGSR